LDGPTNVPSIALVSYANFSYGIDWFRENITTCNVHVVTVMFASASDFNGEDGNAWLDFGR